MNNGKKLLNALSTFGFEFIAGVPDSTLKQALFELETDTRFQHVVATNEGESVALAAGYHLASNSVPCVYLQNAGLGNAINPLTSLCAQKAYAIPALLLIGWRAAPGEKDEPQHLLMGECTAKILEQINVPSFEVTDLDNSLHSGLERAAKHFALTKTPFALLFRRGLVDGSIAKSTKQTSETFTRLDLISSTLDIIGTSMPIVATTGKTSRELYELRRSRDMQIGHDFYNIGAMGFASAIALGICIAKPSQPVCLLDGDGAALMHLGNMVTVGRSSPQKLIHILIDNESHESTGGQATHSAHADIASIAQAVGYKVVMHAQNSLEFNRALHHCQNSLTGPCFIRAHVACGSSNSLGRPQHTPQEMKEAFMETLSKH